MTAKHHPGPEYLMSCSAGSMPEAFAAVMAAHITMCPRCRHDLSIMEDIGKELFEQLSPTALQTSKPAASLRSLESDDKDAKTAATHARPGDVPSPLVPAIGPYLDDLAWERLAAGVWQYSIPLSRGSKQELRLIKVAAGKSLPTHTHYGQELTLVLRGSYRDGTGHYVVGDVADVDSTIEHSPMADPKEGCICLVANQGRVRFRSPLARLVQSIKRV